MDLYNGFKSTNLIQTFQKSITALSASTLLNGI